MESDITSNLLELQSFLDARDILAQNISEYIYRDNLKKDSGLYSTGAGMILHQVIFYIKCIYAGDNRNNESAGKEMRHKYKDMCNVVVAYLNALNDVDDVFLSKISAVNSGQATNVISTFEKGLLGIHELKRLRKESQKKVFFTLSKKA